MTSIADDQAVIAAIQLLIGDRDEHGRAHILRGAFPGMGIYLDQEIEQACDHAKQIIDLSKNITITPLHQTPLGDIEKLLDGVREQAVHIAESAQTIHDYLWI